MRGSHQWPFPILDNEPGEKPCGCITERGQTISPCRSHGDVELSGMLMRDPLIAEHRTGQAGPTGEVGATPMRDEKSVVCGDGQIDLQPVRSPSGDKNTGSIAEATQGPGDVPVLRAHGVTGRRQSPLSIPLSPKRRGRKMKPFNAAVRAIKCLTGIPRIK